MSVTIPGRHDCYSRGERAWMRRYQAWRAVRLRPLLRRLRNEGVRADHLTFLSLAAGLAFCPLFPLAPLLAWGALVLHALLDALDGAVARHQRTASARGSFTDTVADQVVVAASTLTLMGAGVVDLLPGALYILLYTTAVAFAMVRNALCVPYSWILRPRLLVYAWIAVETWTLPGTIDIVLWVLVGGLGLQALSGFHAIRARLAAPDRNRSGRRASTACRT